MKKLTILTILTILCLLSTNELWLVFKPFPVSFKMFGNGEYKVSVILNNKDNNEFKKVKSGSTNLLLSKTEQDTIIYVNHSKFPKRLKLVIMNNATGGTLYVSDFQLNKEKLKINGKNDFIVKNAKIKVADNKLYITPTNNENIEMIYKTPLDVRCSISFKFHVFLLFLIFPSLLVYFFYKFNYSSIPSIIAVIHFLITYILKIDKYFFDYSNINISHLIFVKILSLIFLIIGYNFIYFVYKKIREGTEIYIRGSKLFSIYFIITIILLLLVWPGLWAWDDIWVLSQAIFCEYLPWQHILSSIECMVAIEILPFVAGIIIIRNIIISICFAFTTIKFENTFNLKLNNKFFDYIFKIAPFLLLPVLRYQLSGYRMGLGVYFELVMLCMLICAIKEKTNWSLLYSISFILLSTISITWRSENFIYLPMLCILLLVLKNIGNLQKRLFIVIAIIVGILFINSQQTHYLNKNNENYELMSTMLQATELVRHSNNIDDVNELKTIDKVLKTNIIKTTRCNGVVLYWDFNVVQNGYTKSDYKQYLNAILSLSLKYPNVLLLERINLFINASGIKGYTNTNCSGLYYIIQCLENDKSKSIVSPIFVSFGQRNVLNKAINTNLRVKIAKIILVDRYEFLYKLIWNDILPIITIFASLLITLLMKKWLEALIFITIIAKLVIIFLTAPGSWLMYYLSFYLIGYVIIFYSIISLITYIRSLKH